MTIYKIKEIKCNHCGFIHRDIMSAGKIQLLCVVCSKFMDMTNVKLEEWEGKLK